MKCTTPRRLGLECLESRDLMAGNVTVSVERDPKTGLGNLIVQGDARANNFSITKSGNSFQVSGSTGGGIATTINGITTQAKFDGVDGSIIIDTFKGNDRVTIGTKGTTTVLPQGLTIRTYGGADTVKLYGVQATQLLIRTMGRANERDNDSVEIQESKFTGRSVISTGGGADVVQLIGMWAEVKQSVFTGGGADRITVDGGGIHDFRLNCGGGNDSVTFLGKFEATGNFHVGGSAGGDSARIEDGATIFFNNLDSYEVSSIEKSDLPKDFPVS